MDENKIIETTETLTEVADKIAENSKGSRRITAADVRLIVFISSIAYISADLAFRHVVKPLYGKAKERIELRKQKKLAEKEDEESNVIDGSFGE